MATVLKLGPADHGRPMTREEFEAADYAEGYQYELIDGKLYVSAAPEAPQGWYTRWLFRKLDRYSDEHPEIINYVHPHARVFVSDRTGATNPEPDITAFRDYPVERTIGEMRWQDATPVLVVEVLSAEDPDKDLVRNVELYWQTPTIKEYWVVDARQDSERPNLRVYRRYGKRWKIIDLAYGEVYTTRLFPEFELLIDPRS
jgi:Uma2 family endonuclease